MNNSICRSALDREYKLLSQLAYESEAYWQYNQSYMDIFKEKYNITVEWIKQYEVRVLEVEGEIAGFWGAKRYKEKLELEYFYIEVGHIGKGNGKLLWKDLLSWCKAQGILEMEFVTRSKSYRKGKLGDRWKSYSFIKMQARIESVIDK